MTFISTKTHGIIDYVVGILLIFAPFIFGFAGGGAAMWIPILLGVGIIIYSMLTQYEYSAAKMIPMQAHLALDAAGGLLLVVSPWLFGFAGLIWWPHVVVGIAELLVVAFAERHSSYVQASHTKPRGPVR
jgi:hypothetical protein